MIRVTAGQATLPQSPAVGNLATFPGRSRGSGAICWTIIKYDGVVECCSYPGEMLPVCLYISSYPTTSDPVVIGPTGLTIGGTRSQRTSINTATSIGRVTAPTSTRPAPTVRSVPAPIVTK